MVKNFSACFRFILSALVLLTLMTLNVLAKTASVPLVSGQSNYDTVTINYSSKTKVTGFEVSYSLANSSDSVIVYSGIKTSTVISKLPLGSTVIITVRSYIESGIKKFFSEPSLIKISIGLGVPTLRSSSSKGINALTWTRVDGASSYELSVSTTYSGQYKVIGNLNGLTYSHKVGVKTGRYYRIRAYTIVDGTRSYGAYSKVIYAIS